MKLKNKHKNWNIEEIPPEVWEVWIIQYFNTSVGSLIANKCNETIKKYPEYFKD